MVLDCSFIRRTLDEADPVLLDIMRSKHASFKSVAVWYIDRKLKHILDQIYTERVFDSVYINEIATLKVTAM